MGRSRRGLIRSSMSLQLSSGSYPAVPNSYLAVPK
jgi:hypothetical protein